MKRTALISLLLLAAPVYAADAEVDYLLGWIRASDCTFVRNGDPHSAAEAADHLGMKYRRVARWIDDADEFIERIASGSSMSGKPYLVRCPGSPEQTSAEWLEVALSEHRQHHTAD